MVRSQSRELRIGDRVTVYTVPAIVTDYVEFTQARVQVRFCYGGKPKWFARRDVVGTEPTVEQYR